MGTDVFDQYSILHFISGMIAHQIGVSKEIFSIAHLLFEYFENTPQGIKYLQTITYWPGGKTEADSLINSFGDQISAQLGYIFASKRNLN